jgi:predicted HicB family RNase H-like nuclease
MGQNSNKGAPVSRDSDKFMLRLPGDMRTVIGELAASSGRSMNAEIVMRLKSTLSGSQSGMEQCVDDGERYTRITLRIPKALHASLVETAAATSKSLNAEIIGQLEAQTGGTSTIEKIEQHLQAIRSMMEQQHKQIGPEVVEHPEAGTSVPLIAYERKHNAIK